jgi:hypothetical protein
VVFAVFKLERKIAQLSEAQEVVEKVVYLLANLLLPEPFKICYKIYLLTLTFGVYSICSIFKNRARVTDCQYIETVANLSWRDGHRSRS